MNEQESILMIRVLLYLLLVVLIGTGFAWLASYPGVLVMTVGGSRVTVSLVTAFSVTLLTLGGLMLLWWLARAIVMSPVRFRRRWQSRRQDHGHRLLSSGLIAALAGDAAAARRLARQSGRLLDRREEPLLLLLEAQTRLLDLDHEGAVRLFEKMRKDPQIRLLALKGLFREALKSGATEAARQYAQEAAALNPGLEWASIARLEELAACGEWERAIALHDTFVRAQSRAVAGDQKLLRRRVVLMTAQAQDMAGSHPDTARRIALRAHRLQPSFVPAATVAARILFNLEELRKGSRLIEAMWKVAPHPDLGLAYVNAGSGESAAGRLKRARQLARVNAGNRESQMLVARTALEAGELALARRQAETVAREAPTEGTFLLLADIEAAATGDQGKIRHWLSRAVQAEPDMAWIADGVSLVEWQPLSPLSGRLGVCKWETPPKRPQGVAGGPDAFMLRTAAQRDEKPSRSLTIDMTAGRTGAGKRSAAEKFSAAGAGETDPVRPPNVDVEPPDERDETASPVTRIIVDDPGVNDDDDLGGIR